MRRCVTRDRSRVTTESTNSTAPGPSMSTLRSIEKSISAAASRHARYSPAVSETTAGARYPNRSIQLSVIAASLE